MNKILYLITAILLIGSLEFTIAETTMQVTQQLIANVIGDPLQITIYSPEDGIYNHSKTQFNISINAQVEKIEYINHNDNRPNWKTLCRNCEEYGFSKKKIKSLSEGENKLTIKAINNSTILFKNLSLFIDSKDPAISKTTPKRNKFANGFFETEFKELNPISLMLYYGNDSQKINLTSCYDANRKTYCNASLNLSAYDNQEIEYYFELTDIAENKDQSRPISIKIDTTAPILNNDDSFWTQGDGRFNRYIYFNLNITEQNFEEITYTYIDSKGKEKEKLICSRLKNDICNKRKSFSKGEYNLTINIKDQAQNIIQKPISFIVN